MAPRKSNSKGKDKDPSERVTINNLPPEIISLIVENVELIVAQDQRRPPDRLAGLAEDLGMGFDDMLGQGPAAFLAMMGGLMGAAGAGPAAPAPPPPAPPVANNANARPPTAPLNPGAQPFTFGARPPATATTAPPATVPGATAAPGAFTFGAPAPVNLGFNLTLPPFAPATGGAPGATPAPGQRNESDDDMPALEPISDDEHWGPRAATSNATPSSTTAAAPVAPQPTVASTSAQPFAVASSQPVARPSSVTTDTDNEDDDMPPLEPIDDEEMPTRQRPVMPGTFGSPASEAEDPDESMGDDEDDEDDEDYTEGDDDLDDDDSVFDSDAESDDDSDQLFPDGLPQDPLLPLLFASRPFLHAARQKLYRIISLTDPYHASLLLAALAAPTHAARNAAEDEEDPDGPRNTLGRMVRTLTFDGKPDMTLQRGGAQVYLDVLKTCVLLEDLSIRPTFLKSVTKPFLETLRSLRHLKRGEFASSVDPKRPFIFTSARVFALMQQSWPKLEELSIAGLKSAENGPSSEEDDMWDWEYQEEEEAAAAALANEGGEDEGVSALDVGEKSASPQVREKPVGLKQLRLVDPDVPYLELALVLKDSPKTLKKLQLSRPTPSLSRYGLASTMLRFGNNLTELTLDVLTSWHPRPKPEAGTPKIPFPLRPKDFVAGQPSDELLSNISTYPYILDALMPYLPHLTTCHWDGPLASTSVFSFFPISLKTISWAHCPGIQPAVLARLLRKQVTRTRTVTNADGSKTSKTYKTIVARGLQCMSVVHDDLNWKDVDLDALEGASDERGMCLHLSGGSTAANAGGMGGAGVGGGFGFPGFGGGGLAPIVLPFALGGGMGLGGGAGGLGGGGGGP